MPSPLLACQALLERDLRGILRSRSQLYSSIILPLLLLAILGAGVSEGLDPALVRDGDYASFLVPGAMVMTVLFSSTFSSASFYYDRDWGMLKVLFASPHSPWIILLGKSLAGIAVGAGQAMFVLLVTAVVPAIDLQWQYGIGPGILLAVLSVLLLAILLNGFAQVVASRVRTMQGFHLLMNLVLFPLLFFSGAFFPLEDLPLWLKVLAAIDPLSYAVDFLRLALYADGSTYFPWAVDLAVLVTLGPALLIGGLRPRPASLW